MALEVALCDDGDVTVDEGDDVEDRQPRSQAPSEKSEKGPGSASMHFLSTITSQNFEESIRLQKETTRNVIPSHAHEAKSADYAIW